VTALRETHEEVGIHPDKMEIIKFFTPTYIPPSNFMVHPFLESVKRRFVLYLILLKFPVLLNYHYPSLDKIIIDATLSTSYAKTLMFPPLI
jgi:8-oxo-dGTP pyrophosphatase MutT (NUDIX family)